MDPSARVCPYCGEPPGTGVFCAACGRSLADVSRLPSAAEWAADAAREPALDGAQAVDGFLAAMHAAGDPGAKQFPVGKPNLLGRTRHIRGWVVRPVDREDFSGPKRYVPGLVLTVDGRFHQLDSELRGWGQRDFPTYHHTASTDPVDAPLDARLVEELAALRAAHGVELPKSRS
jgi:hypothetical protein